MGFDLHVSLAEKLDITSFRKLKTLSVRGGVKGRTDRDRPTWLDGIAQSRLMDANTAQVGGFTRAYMRKFYQGVPKRMLGTNSSTTAYR